MTLRQETEGSFSDSYLHQLSLSLKLVKFFRECFQVPLDGFLNVGKRLFAVLSLTNCSRKLNALSKVSAFRLLPKYYGKFPSLDFHHKVALHKRTTVIPI